jgi:hypothetical protein
MTESGWSPSILAYVEADNDYASQAASTEEAEDTIRPWNNLAQRNVAVVDGEAGEVVRVPFVLGIPDFIKYEYRVLAILSRLPKPHWPMRIELEPRVSGLGGRLESSVYGLGRVRSSTGRVVSERGSLRSVELVGPITEFEIEKLPTTRSEFHLHVEVPRGTPPGEYPIDLVAELKDGSLAGGARILLRVPEARKKGKKRSSKKRPPKDATL